MFSSKWPVQLIMVICVTNQLGRYKHSKSLRGQWFSITCIITLFDPEMWAVYISERICSFWVNWTKISCITTGLTSLYMVLNKTIPEPSNSELISVSFGGKNCLNSQNAQIGSSFKYIMYKKNQSFCKQLLILKNSHVWPVSR